MAQHARFSASISNIVSAWPVFANARNIGGFIPMLGEVDVMLLFTHAAEKGASLWLPRLLADGRFEFAAYAEGSLVKGPRGVMQPAPEAAVIPLARLDLVLVPALAFDRSGYRLGMGAGFYDKTLAEQKSCPKTLGVAFGAQLVDTLPRDVWDVPVNAVVTELGLYEVPALD